MFFFLDLLLLEMYEKTYFPQGIYGKIYHIYAPILKKNNNMFKNYFVAAVHARSFFFFFRTGATIFRTGHISCITGAIFFNHGSPNISEREPIT